MNQHTSNVQVPYLPFREVYNACFMNGVSLAESMTIFIKRAVTTLTKKAAEFRHLSIRLEVPPVVSNHSELAEILHREYPHGFFSDNIFIGLTIENGEEIPEMVMHDLSMSGILRSFEIAYVPSKKFDGLLEKLRTMEFNPTISMFSANGVDDNGNLQGEEVDYDPPLALHPTSFFYPFLAEFYGKSCANFKLDEFVAEFMNSRDNALIMTGPKGTGKSSLSREFFLPETEIIVLASEAALMNPNITKTFRHKPKNKGFRMLTVYDESDNFLRAKEDGNYNMAALLNHLDGAIPTREKFIFISNLDSTHKLDERLTRVNRCFLSIPFRLLTPAEANLARESIGLPPYEFTRNVAMVDAITAERDNNRKAGVKQFGFAPSK